MRLQVQLMQHDVTPAVRHLRGHEDDPLHAASQNSTPNPQEFTAHGCRPAGGVQLLVSFCLESCGVTAALLLQVL